VADREGGREVAGEETERFAPSLSGEWGITKGDALPAKGVEAVHPMDAGAALN
jgi:hypothetical protein